MVLLRQLAPVEGTTRALGQHPLAALHSRVVDLDGDDVDPVASEDFHDAGAHGAEPDHAN